MANERNQALSPSQRLSLSLTVDTMGPPSSYAPAGVGDDLGGFHGVDALQPLHLLHECHEAPALHSHKLQNRAPFEAKIG